jgi:hypothetical protein
MDTDYLYKWVTIQLNSGIPKEEIVKNIVNFAKLSREEADNFVNDPLYRENFNYQVIKQQKLSKNLQMKILYLSSQV